MVVPVVLLCVDIATVYMGVTLNDSVCRDAARAASLGAPDGVTPGEPLRRAEAVVKKANRTDGALRLDPKVLVAEKITAPLPQPPYGGPVKGEVTVTTKVHVFPPFLLSTFSSGQGLEFSTDQTFSYTWAMASTAKMAVPSAGDTSNTF